MELAAASLSGYISVEQNPEAKRTLQSNFPGAEHYGNVEDLSEEVIASLAAKYPRTSWVLVAGAPPCQGVSGLNAEHLGLNDRRSGLYAHVELLRKVCAHVLSWCEICVLMESVFSMDGKDRVQMTRSVGIIPFRIDALGVSLCRRPRLWWFDWVVEGEPGVYIHLPLNAEAKSWGQISFDADVTPESYLPPDGR